jgi:hypothetical protein
MLQDTGRTENYKISIYWFNYTIYLISFFLWLYSPCGPWPPAQTQNKRTPLVGLKPTIPSFERAKTVHALDLAATVIGIYLIQYRQNPSFTYAKAKRNMENSEECFRYMFIGVHVHNFRL